MRRRALGRTGLIVSELGLGTWGLCGDAYGPMEAGSAERVILRAVELGIDLFDTADAYGAGRMEALLGRLLRGNHALRIVTRGGVDRTQTPPRKTFEAEYLRGAVERSLRRLGRERIDVYLLHHPGAEALAKDELIATMVGLQQAGKVLHWGISSDRADVARFAIDRGAEVISIAHNLLNAVELHRLSGDIMVAGTGVLVHSVLGYGLLAGTWSKEKTFADGDHRAERWSQLELAQKLSQLNALRFLVKGDVRTLRSAAVRYALADHVVSSALLGPRSVEQLDQLVRETGGGPTYLPDQDLAGLPRALSKVGVQT